MEAVETEEAGVRGDSGAEGGAMGDDERAELVGQLRDSALARAAVYRMLASFYLERLDAVTIERLASALDGGVPIDNPLIVEGYADMAAFLRDRDGGTGLELSVDFACSIRDGGAQGERRAVPREGLFAPQPDLPADRACDAVADLVRRAGLEGDGELRLQVPRDHLGFACAFMARLADRECEALDGGELEGALASVEMQRAMHAGHLLNWIDAYCDRLDEVAATRFYRGVSKLTRGYVREEKDFIDDSCAAIEELIAAR